jgi:hypothetical protein
MMWYDVSPIAGIAGCHLQKFSKASRKDLETLKTGSKIF